MNERAYQTPYSDLRGLNTLSLIGRGWGTPEEKILEDDSSEIRQRKESANEKLRDQLRSDREEFIKLYQRAAMAYINGCLCKRATGITFQDVGAVWSDLVIRLLEGKIGSYDPKSPFRPFLKRILWNDCTRYLRDRWKFKLTDEGSVNPISVDHSSGKTENKNPSPKRAKVVKTVTIEPGMNEPVAFDPEDDTMELELKRTIVKRAYESMHDDGLYGAAVLFSASKGGKFTSQELADHLTEMSGKPIKVDTAKKRLQRGRENFSETLLEQVAKLDGINDIDRLEETVIALDLMGNCKKALEKMRA